MGSREPGSDALVISSLADIERLRSSPVRLWKLDGSIELRIPHLAQRERIESRLNELAGVCGCAEGSVAGAIALVAVVALWTQREIAFSYRSVFTAAALVIGASLLAKLVRVIAARVRLRQLLGDLLHASSGSVPQHHGGSA